MALGVCRAHSWHEAEGALQILTENQKQILSEGFKELKLLKHLCSSTYQCLTKPKAEASGKIKEWSKHIAMLLPNIPPASNCLLLMEFMRGHFCILHCKKPGVQSLLTLTMLPYRRSKFRVSPTWLRRNKQDLARAAEPANSWRWGCIPTRTCRLQASWAKLMFYGNTDYNRPKIA